ncbi:MAG: IscS subfamily cysteine desulfurase [Deltaproteobacteria bacterium]|nr:IscS subfamily cysteine desulfurase [Deltaproteobacteria bacterium]MCW5805295.1 IscS subfamily cysteine desulfurase [Deltaproteobacteria bacterium]
MKLPIFLDNHSTTAVDPRVVETMIPFFTEHYGNAASRNHVFGWTAEAAVENARGQIAALLGGDAKEIVLTSGATESNNLAIKGAASFLKKQGNHIITVETEHKSVLDTCKRLQREGFEITYLRPAKDGLVTPEQVVEAMTDKTILVSIMVANNEIGVVQPIEAIGAAVKARNPKALFHTDAVQAFGKVPFDVEKAKVDLAAVSAHKLYGPKGIGALWVRRKPRVRIDPIIDGGGHERGMRSGTLPVPLIVGFGKAAALAMDEMAAETLRVRALRDRLYRGITSRLTETYVNGSLECRLPGNLNISFAFVEGESLLMALKDIAVSSGSACTSASLEPSYVLRALGVGDELAHTSIRFGIGRFNTEAEVDYVIELVARSVERLRSLSPLWEMHQDGIDLNSIQWTPH